MKKRFLVIGIVMLCIACKCDLTDKSYSIFIDNKSELIISSYFAIGKIVIFGLLGSKKNRNFAKNIFGREILFGFHSHLLNFQLLVRQLDIYSSPYLYRIP